MSNHQDDFDRFCFAQRARLRSTLRSVPLAQQKAAGGKFIGQDDAPDADVITKRGLPVRTGPTFAGQD